MSHSLAQSAGSLDAPFRRDRAIVLIALVTLTGLSWVYLFYDARRMTAGICEMCMPLAHAWTLHEILIVFVMWAIMMIGMMTPSVTPAVLLFAGLNRQRRIAGRPVVSTFAFLGGYLLIWMIFSLVATLLQAWLHHAALLSPAMVSRSPALGGGLLIAAGIFQWLPIKNVCLRHCRSPLDLFIAHWREGATGAVRMGFDHGLQCAGCCWLLMALLFVAGVMNLLWVLGITLFVLVEKVTPTIWISRIAGLAMAGWGVWMFVATN
jgi:predicted metal-binding membrane protein